MSENKSIPKIELYYERYMKNYDYVDNYKKLGHGTLFGGDSGYIDNYDELIERLKYDINRYAEHIDSNIKPNDIEFIKVRRLTTFIKGHIVSWD